jgi:hypothetical protein
MDDYGPKASAVAALRENAALLDDYARNGVPARLGLGFIRGTSADAFLEAIRSYVPPPPKPQPTQNRYRKL